MLLFKQGDDIMGIYKTKTSTKDGRCWFFKMRYIGVDGIATQKHSKKYSTKKEAETAEFSFKMKLHNNENMSNITFEEMMNLFIDYKKDKVKETTYYNYGNKKLYLEPLYKIKLKDFNIQHFENWRQNINNTHLSTKYKNDILKFLKSILNYASVWYEFNFNKVYSKMVNFTNPNEVEKEMMYFTYEQFKQFLSVEDNLKFRVIFEILYYCGLRRGELRGLTWSNIDFNHNTLSVKKQITDRSGTVKNFCFSTPKTKSSIRTLPLNKVLLEDIKKLKEEDSKLHGFNNNYFVAGDAFPISSNALADRKNRNCDLAGVPQIRIHDFRHSCASLLINSGANVTVVAKYLGHTKIEETLNTYTHLFSTALNEVVNVIDQLG